MLRLRVRVSPAGRAGSAASVILYISKDLGFSAMRARGFSLLECLVGLALSLFVVCACLGFFMAAERSYFKLRDGEEAAQGALAAVDKMRVDVLRAGQGLAPAAVARARRARRRD